MAILNGLDRRQLSKSEEARYALIYTIAQDKSGLDVDNDSLIGLAYSYYDERREDSLYAKCQYYMGKYYMLNLWTEKAIDCCRKSADAAEKKGDRYTLCLALEKWAKLITYTDKHKAITLIRRAIAEYAKIPNAPEVNIVYFKLNLCEFLLQCDSVKAADSVCQEAINLAIALKDDVALSDAYQDMANIQEGLKDFRKQLQYSKKSCSYIDKPDDAKLLNLAWAYMNVDSLHRCSDILNLVKTNIPAYLYTTYYLPLIPQLCV